MKDSIRIQLMDTFAIYINEIRVENILDKSRKGAALLQLLIVNRGKSVVNSRLLDTLWSEESASNPVSSLKTLVSRMRALLDQIQEGFGKCIVADHGAYRWDPKPEISIDLYEIEDLLAELDGCELSEACSEKIEKLMLLYKGDLLQNSKQNEWVISPATHLHSRFVKCVYRYIDYLKEKGRYAEVVSVCRAVLDVDNFDDKLHIELMTALIKLERTNDAMVQYRYVINLYNKYLGISPTDDIQKLYMQIVNCGRALDFDLEVIRNELSESGTAKGAFICEYVVFKDIFNLQIRNLERLGTTMFLSVIMISDVDGKPFEPLKQDKLVQRLMEILKQGLRKGDTVSRFSPTIVAVLLPTVDYTTGRTVMERIKRMFYSAYPNSNVTFNYRIGPLSSDMPVTNPTLSGDRRSLAEKSAQTVTKQGK